MPLPNSPYTPIYICTNLGAFMVAFDGISAIEPSPMPVPKRIQKFWQMRDGSGQVGRRIFAPRGSDTNQMDISWKTSMIDPDDYATCLSSFQSNPGTVIVCLGYTTSPSFVKYHAIWAEDGLKPFTEPYLGYLYLGADFHFHILGLSTVALTGMPD